VSLPRHHYECRSMDAMWLLVVAFVLAAILVVIATSVGIACFRVLSNSEMTAVNRSRGLDFDGELPRHPGQAVGLVAAGCGDFPQ
jgi:hypothetical protein